MMRTVWRVVALVAGAGLGVNPAQAGAFDGNWTGRALPQQGCAGNAVSNLTLIVSGEEVTGIVRNLRDRVAVIGTIDAEGKGSVHVARRYGTIRFSGDKFTMDWESQRGCLRHAEGGREVKPAP